MEYPSLHPSNRAALKASTGALFGFVHSLASLRVLRVEVPLAFLEAYAPAMHGGLRFLLLPQCAEDAALLQQLAAEHKGRGLTVAFGARSDDCPKVFDPAPPAELLC